MPSAMVGRNQYARRNEPTPRTIGALLVAYLDACVLVLTVHAGAVADLGWLLAQDAAEVAVLHSVMVDKAVRLLEAMAPATNAASGARGRQK